MIVICNQKITLICVCISGNFLLFRHSPGNHKCSVVWPQALIMIRFFYWFPWNIIFFKFDLSIKHVTKVLDFKNCLTINCLYNHTVKKKKKLQWSIMKMIITWDKLKIIRKKIIIFNKNALTTTSLVLTF